MESAIYVKVFFLFFFYQNKFICAIHVIFFIFFVLIVLRKVEKMAAEFCALDSNDKWISNCGSKVFSKDHNIRINSVMMYPNEKDMNYLEFQKVFECYLAERKFYCKFCKVCNSCRCLKHLGIEYQTLMLNSWRKSGKYVTAVRFCSENLNYTKTLCMTVVILNHRFVDLNFIEDIEEREKKNMKTL